MPTCRFGAKTVWIIRVCMVVLAPVAWPLAFILNKVLLPPATACEESLACALVACTAPLFTNTSHSGLSVFGNKVIICHPCYLLPYMAYNIGGMVLLLIRQYGLSQVGHADPGARGWELLHTVRAKAPHPDPCGKL